jgi:hypothetical protein
MVETIQQVVNAYYGQFEAGGEPGNDRRGRGAEAGEPPAGPVEPEEEGQGQETGGESVCMRDSALDAISNTLFAEGRG